MLADAAKARKKHHFWQPSGNLNGRFVLLMLARMPSVLPGTRCARPVAGEGGRGERDGDGTAQAPASACVVSTSLVGSSFRPSIVPRHGLDLSHRLLPAPRITGDYDQWRHDPGLPSMCSVRPGRSPAPRPRAGLFRHGGHNRVLCAPPRGGLRAVIHPPARANLRNSSCRSATKVRLIPPRYAPGFHRPFVSAIWHLTSGLFRSASQARPRPRPGRRWVNGFRRRSSCAIGGHRFATAPEAESQSCRGRQSLVSRGRLATGRASAHSHWWRALLRYGG